MKKLLLILLYLFNTVISNASDWTTTSIFNFKVFVENKGQLSNNENFLSDPIEYSCKIDGMQIYFTKKGLTYRYDKKIKMSNSEIRKTEENGEENEGILKSIPHYIHMDWLNASSNVQIIGEKEVSYYFTYGNIEDASGKTGFKAAAYKKIIYKNLFPNIDVEYFFPENKEGVKYNIVLHPGADPTLIKMNYTHTQKMIVDTDGNMQITAPFGNIIDHAPLCFYSSSNSNIPSSYNLNENNVSFNISDYDKSQTVIIDPWTTIPAFPVFNTAYDVEYDFMGNVYIHGGNGQTAGDPYQEIKLNNAGAIQWVYSCLSFVTSYGAFYGDFAVDGNSGSSYIIESLQSNLINHARVIKLNSAGLQVGVLLVDSSMVEMWRIEYNNCTKKAVIAGGGPFSGLYNNACILDTNLVSSSPINILGATTVSNDFALLAMDNSGNYYMATSSLGLTFSNMLLKGPVNATMLPLTYLVPDGHKFKELTSVTYTSTAANGFNGMAVNSKNVYTYDGKLIQRWNKNTGILIDSATISSLPPFKWGGITIDDCDHIFVGLNNSIIQLDTSFNKLDTIITSDIVCDVTLAPGNILYACGKDFISSFASGVTCNSSNLNVTLTLGSTCNSFTASVSGGVPSYSYYWLPGGGTGATASGLSSGTYTVTVSDNACNSATASITILNSTLTTTISNIQPSCTNSTGSATVAVSGGTPGYTYFWAPSGGTAITASGLTPGTYTVTVTDLAGCSQTSTTTINAINNTISLTSFTTAAICTNNNGTASVVATGGTPAYSYLWIPSGGNSSIANNLGAGTYTVTVTDLNGCTQTITTIINSITDTLLLTTISTPTLCTNTNGTAIVSITGGTPTYTYSWLPNGGTNATAIGLATGTYTVTVSDLNGCSQSATVTISNIPSTLSITMSNTPAICTSNTGTATAIVSGGTPGYIYLWSPNGGISSSANGLTAGTYTITVIDTNGCIQTASTIINSINNILTVNTNSTPAICVNNNGTVSAIVTGGTPGYSYYWLPNGGINANVSGLSSGTYTVTVTDINGCFQTSTTFVNSISGTNVSISSNITINVGDSTILYASGGNNYVWSPLTGLSCSNCQAPTASPLQTTIYCVAVTDNNGCVDTACVKVEVEIQCPTINNLKVPNAFSPNNDQVNDEFCLQGWDACFSDFKIIIFNRWGEKVFESKEPDFCWDGTYKGKIIDAQVFVYSINAKHLISGEKIHKKGNITLIK